jgi:Ni/Co efflux regulator RcnB
MLPVVGWQQISVHFAGNCAIFATIGETIYPPTAGDLIMQKPFQKSVPVLALVLAGVFSIPSAYADKPDGAGGGNSGKREHKKDRDERGHDRNGHDGDYGRDDRRGDDRRGGDRYDDARHSRSSPQMSAGVYFNDREREYAHSYYHDEFNRGNCPPGLAKKHNGCLPPGQAKKWHRGQPLGRDVVYYPVPNEVLIRLRPPPPHHEYVRVASDILLIAVGTGMVVDAIEDLGR